MHTARFGGIPERLEESREYKTARKLEQALNDMGFNPERFAETLPYFHKTLEHAFFRVMKACIIGMAKREPSHIDGRNRAAYEMCRMLAPMLLQAIGAIANIILDPILIFGLFGAPRMGVRGAAVATVLGQVLSMTLSLLVFFLRDQDVRMDLKKFKPDLHAVAQIYAVGVPTMLMNALGSVLVTLLNSILIRFSELAVSVFGVYFKLQTFVFMPVSGLTQGALPIMGYNYGAQNQKRLLATLRCAVLVAVGIMAAGNLLFALMPDKLLLLFDASPDMLGIGVPALRIISCSYVFAAIGLILSNLFQAVGKGAYSLTVFLMRQLIVVVPLAFLLSRTMGLNGIWVAFPIAEAAGAVAAALFFLIFRRKDAIFHQAAVPQPEAGD